MLLRIASLVRQSDVTESPQAYNALIRHIDNKETYLSTKERQLVRKLN